MLTKCVRERCKRIILILPRVSMRGFTALVTVTGGTFCSFKLVWLNARVTVSPFPFA